MLTFIMTADQTTVLVAANQCAKPFPYVFGFFWSNATATNTTNNNQDGTLGIYDVEIEGYIVDGSLNTYTAIKSTSICYFDPAATDCPSFGNDAPYRGLAKLDGTTHNTIWKFSFILESTTMNSRADLNAMALNPDESRLAVLYVDNTKR